MNSAVGLFALVVAVVIIIVIVQAWMDRQRRLALAALAAKLNLQYRSDKSGDLATRYQFLNKLNQGSNRYAMNIISGSYKGDNVDAFDYHYETHTTNSKGHRQTHHHIFSVFILRLPREFPELTIAREGFLSKFAQAFGYDDIDFESHEFSKTFCVRSPDKKFAYDVCNARMMEYLLDNRDLSIEIERTALALLFDAALRAEDFEVNLNRLKEIRSRMPDYLLDRTSS